MKTVLYKCISNNANIKDMCYQRHIKDIVTDIIGVVEKTCL